MIKIKKSVRTFVLRVIDYFKRKPYRIYFPIIFIALLIFIFLTLVATKLLLRHSFQEGLIVELFGMILDAVILGLIVSYILYLREKRIEIRNAEDNIDTYRLIKSKEATQNIINNIRKLNRFKKFDINLSHCTLEGALFYMFNVYNMENSKFENTILNNASLIRMNLKNCFFLGTKFENATLLKSDLSNSNSTHANFKNANLSLVNFSNANLKFANFENSSVDQAIFVRSDLRYCKMRNVEHLKSTQLIEAKTLYGAKLSPSILEKLKNYSQLFEKPEDEE